MKARLPVLILGLSALGACASVPPPEPGALPIAGGSQRHAISVTESSQRIEIAVAQGDVGLSNASRAEVRALASGYLRYGHGALVLSSPIGSPNSDSASLIAHEARMALMDAGVSHAAIAGSSYDGAGENAPVILSFARYEAQAPECAPLWEQDLAHQSNNQPWASFGCSTQANLAALIEDPRDLLRARAEDPRDSNRRTVVMQAYRQGEQTHSERSNDERIQISNAVQ